MTLYFREIETTTKSYELVDTPSSSPAYVEHDKRRRPVTSIPTAKPVVKVLENWREANPIERAIFTRGEGIDD